MIRRVILSLSVLANLGLGAAWWHARGLAPATSSPAATTAVTKPAPARQPAVAQDKIWSDLTSDADDVEYVARLRADGFPPRMVRLLVYFRLQERFAAQSREFAAKNVERPYWRTETPSGNLDTETRAKRRALSRQLGETARSLLGADADKMPGDPGYDDQKRLYGSIPALKIAALEAILRDYGEMAAQLRETARWMALPEDREKLAFLDRERRADIAKVLTPEELDDYDRRNSPAANAVRNQVRYFDPTEDEFLKLYHLQHDFDQHYGVDNLSGEQSDRRKAAQPELVAQIAAALGPERFAEYQVLTDGNYSGTRSFVTGLGLNPDAAKSLVALQRETSRQAEALRSDRSIAGEQRTALLAELQKNAEGRVSAIVSAEKLNNYKRAAGTWLVRLAPPASSGAR